MERRGVESARPEGKAPQIYFTKSGNFAKREIFSIKFLIKKSINYFGFPAEIGITILLPSLNLNNSGAKVGIVRWDDSGPSSTSRHLLYLPPNPGRKPS
jgi:hypothetical protein